MIGTSFAGVQVDARRIVDVLDNLNGAIEQCDHLADFYRRYAMAAQAAASEEKAAGLRHAAGLLHEVLDDIEAR